MKLRKIEPGRYYITLHNFGSYSEISFFIEDARVVADELAFEKHRPWQVTHTGRGGYIGSARTLKEAKLMLIEFIETFEQG